MSKRTPGLARRKHDAYDTPAHAVSELLKHLLPGTRFIEPCAGKGDLIRHLEAAGHVCVGSFDVAPRSLEGGRIIGTGNAITQTDLDDFGASCIITNPPWSRHLLHPIIENLSNQLPTWLLFDADWPNNAKIPMSLLDRCERIVPQGRIRWLLGDEADKGHGGKDNAAWYRFDATHSGGPRWFNRRNRHASQVPV
jgi:hypothetical protein